jgi:EAL domain-containing protein (putative c-di-GMP-specific phosphodiesterase class I)
LRSTPSIGIAIFPSDGEDVGALMKAADTAMYHAKSQGRANYQFFTEAMNRVAAERLRLENALRQALEQNEFTLHFQPQIDIGSGSVVAVEALIRWQSQTMGLVPPDKFIPLAEEVGLIEAIGRWVLEQSGRECRRLVEAGHAGIRVAVNLSMQQLRKRDIVAVVRRVLQENGITPGQLELEVTETVTMEAPETTIGVLRQLRGLGVLLSVDDFGIGYSSLARLKLLPIHGLKLDRTLVGDIETDANDAAICAAAIAMAHSLGLKVVAEGVETAIQLRHLRDLGCDMAQGYYISRPLPVAELDLYLERSRQGSGIGGGSV